jgi:hypothetical protein
LTLHWRPRFDYVLMSTFMHAQGSCDSAIQPRQACRQASS